MDMNALPYPWRDTALLMTQALSDMLVNQPFPDKDDAALRANYRQWLDTTQAKLGEYHDRIVSNDPRAPSRGAFIINRIVHLHTAAADTVMARLGASSQAMRLELLTALMDLYKGAIPTNDPRMVEMAVNEALSEEWVQRYMRLLDKLHAIPPLSPEIGKKYGYGEFAELAQERHEWAHGVNQSFGAHYAAHNAAIREPEPEMFLAAQRQKLAAAGFTRWLTRHVGTYEKRMHIRDQIGKKLSLLNDCDLKHPPKPPKPIEVEPYTPPPLALTSQVKARSMGVPNLQYLLGYRSQDTKQAWSWGTVRHQQVGALSAMLVAWAQEPALKPSAEPAPLDPSKKRGWWQREFQASALPAQPESLPSTTPGEQLLRWQVLTNELLVSVQSRKPCAKPVADKGGALSTRPASVEERDSKVEDYMHEAVIRAARRLDGKSATAAPAPETLARVERCLNAAQAEVPEVRRTAGSHARALLDRAVDKSARGH